MGAPLKRLFLSPRVVKSPLSPLSPISPPCFGGNKAKNALDVPNSCANRSECCFTPPRFVSAFAKSKFLEKPKKSRGCLLVDTPNKLEIMKHGVRAREDLSVLGRGNFGTVVRGEYRGQKVAVKVAKGKLTPNEANALKLRHENVIRVLDVITQNECNSIILMECLGEAVRLQTLLDQERHLTLTEMINFSKQLSEGLRYCHSSGVLHLDVKPANILISENVCKICDFGNSRRIDDVDSYTHEGTAVYTAPEIFSGRNPTAACDVYSLGITFWQMRHREIPYANLENNDVVIYKLRPVTKGRRDFYTELYEQCWTPEPKTRPVISDVIAALNKFRF